MIFQSVLRSGAGQFEDMIQFDKTGSVLDIVIKSNSSWAYISELELFGFPA